LIDLLGGVIEQHPFPLSTRVLRLRAVLTKLRPVPELPTEEEDALDDEPGNS